MQTGQPSRTARAAAAHRATHQLLEQGRIFADPLALPILGESADALELEAADHPLRRHMRLFIAARTRFTEDALAAAYARGVRQLVVLGAGLDTFACRNPHRDLRVFEVDHPATQSWKRARLAEAGMAAPDSLTFAPVDFERQTLADGLRAAGFDAMRRAFFSWLGVVPYLTDAAIFSTLAMIGALPGGAQVVFDYAEPPETLGPEARAGYERRAAQVAALGEPWLSTFDPLTLAGRLRPLGFSAIEDLGPPQIAQRYLAAPAGNARGGHVILAGTD